MMRQLTSREGRHRKLPHWLSSLSRATGRALEFTTLDILLCSFAARAESILDTLSEGDTIKMDQCFCELMKLAFGSAILSV